jgi:hypothetical protein
MAIAGRMRTSCPKSTNEEYEGLDLVPLFILVNLYTDFGNQSVSYPAGHQNILIVATG